MADPVVTSHHGIAPPADPDATVTVTIDGRAVTATAGEFLIAAAERAGTFIPRFCYHPRMKPVGMCRMCLVEVAGARGATLQPACYVPVADGMEVDTTSAKVKKAQDGVLEFLLVNHPLDCPVCDKGGECPLQDQVLAYGPGESRFLEEKRHWAKPIPISELVLLDRERCIQCGRCVRFANEVAGEAQIDFLGRGDTVEVNVFEDQAFSSYFSGNTVQICPVGALTASPYRFTRPARGTSTRWSRRARRAPSVAGWRCSRRPTASPACWAWTATRSTRAGCVTRGGSPTRRSTPSNAHRAAAAPAADPGSGTTATSSSRRRGPRR